MSDTVLYLDHAAATPVDPQVLTCMMPYFSEKFYNPSSPYAAGVMIKREYAAAKQRIARTLGVQADELVMTAGATESINMAFMVADEELVVGAIEHAAVLAAAQSRGTVVLAPTTKKGHITAEAVARSLGSRTTLVSVGLVNNELGTIQPIEDIARIVQAERERRRAAGETQPLLLHCDASQAAALIDVKAKRLGVDLLTLSAAKVYGPKQVGLLWVRPGVTIRPTIVGGGQESGLRSGTENVAGVIGFAEALELAAKRRQGEVKRLRRLRDAMQRTIIEAVPDTIVSSDSKKGLVNFLHVSFPGVDAERLVFLLEAQGVMVATGSACAANKGARSAVLTAIGLREREIDGSLRISLGRLSNDEQIERATRCIIEAVQRERARSAQRDGR